MKMLLMGNEAIARGAMEAGINVATSYPGTPASEVFATLARHAPEVGFYAEWSVNEKVAVELAAGAAYAGGRAIVSMKQMGLNVASDAVMSLAYIGVRGGLVLVVADDPGPHSSQTEQDTRLFARFAGLPVLDPSSPAEAYAMTKYAFTLSEELGLPVILRPTTRCCHSCQDVEVGTILPPRPVPGFTRSPEWVILPSLSARKHRWLVEQEARARLLFNVSPFNTATLEGRTGVITSGVSYGYVVEAMEQLGVKLSLLKIGTPYPLPQEKVVEFLAHLDQVLIVEEQEPVVEEQVIHLAWRQLIPCHISGKHDDYLPRTGEFNVDIVRAALARFLGVKSTPPAALTPPELPQRAPTLCAGCPHRGSFYAFKRAARGQEVIFSGDIGCYTLGAAPPLRALDTCLCMGASLGLAQGLARIEPQRRVVAFIGDSTFFHAGLPALANIAHHKAPVTMAVLDNGTTAMTGHQPHPGMSLDIKAIARACGITCVLEADPYHLEATIQAASQALAEPGPSIVLLRRPCPQVTSSERCCTVDPSLCTGCGFCLKEVGCPAMSWKGDHINIGPTCNGCSLCAQICPAGAIREVRK
ncbi:MAG: indolepyruvate ferredoxin oxidoreductase subunit alpha [Thermoanaerobacteraceae bacterium]|nr:indolepyruvate ferredoxin oxidoreductase subunit alpha [Thermoanaerobacteraceae bacterium]